MGEEKFNLPVYSLNSILMVGLIFSKSCVLFFPAKKRLDRILSNPA